MFDITIDVMLDQGVSSPLPAAKAKVPALNEGSYTN